MARPQRLAPDHPLVTDCHAGRGVSRFFQVRTYRLFLVLFLSAFLVGCTTPRLLYGWIDWLIPWKVSSYVDLDASQRQSLDSLIEKELKWHRSSELSQYLQHLTDFRDDIDRPMTPEQVLMHFDRATGHWDRFLAQLIPGITPLIQSLTDEQVAQIMEKINEDHQELKEKHLKRDQAERLKYANKAIADSIRPWVERLSPYQKRVISEFTENREQNLEQWLAYRGDWIARMQQALEQRKDTKALNQALTTLLVEPNSLKSEKYRQSIELNRASLADSFVVIQKSLNSRQKRHLRKKINELADDVQYFVTQ